MDEERACYGISKQDWEQLQRWNISCPESTDSCIHDLIHQRARIQPDAIAICSWDGRLTYRELDEITSRVALWLKQEGVGPDTRIPICYEKSKWALISMIAIIKSGGAFVPLDPNQPLNRLNVMIDELGSRIVVTSTLTAKVFNRGAHARPVIIGQDLLNRIPSELTDISDRVTSDQTAFIMFTVSSLILNC